MNKPVTKSYVDENIPQPPRFSYILYKLERITDFIVNVCFSTAAILIVFGMLILYFSSGLQIAPKDWPSIQAIFAEGRNEYNR